MKIWKRFTVILWEAWGVKFMWFTFFIHFTTLGYLTVSHSPHYAAYSSWSCLYSLPFCLWQCKRLADVTIRPALAAMWQEAALLTEDADKHTLLRPDRNNLKK